ncbi:hypothetical protein ACLM5J_10330 [Nocardioides sp. Bht2]|uniref:hypothetical protein n=1 Tax=Nocardioides sp. Bht2 TaxID=3392297 RepID=UPI0039B6BE56
MSGACGNNVVDPLAFELASWLESLGLAGHLADAGLPHYQRDADGTPRWRDPATGKAMSTDQLHALEAMLRNQGDEPEHGVPLNLLQVARQAKVREQLTATPSHSYESLAELRGESVNATRFFVHKGADEHRVLLVRLEEKLLIPAFQFDAAGAPRTELADVLTPLLVAGMDPWQAWGWLTGPAALLGGAVPAEAAADPDEAPIVQHAARRLARSVAQA